METKTTIIDAMTAYFDAKQKRAQPLGSLIKIRVLYNFNHSKMGFQNSILVDAFDNDHALILAQKEIAMVYGSKMLKRFSFKIA